MTDLGPLRVTFTTQAVYVGVHRELDDRTGKTDYIGLGDGDAAPSGTADDIEVTLMTADSRGRLRVLEYDDDADPETPDARAEATAGASGIVSFKNIPADTEITVVVDEGSGKVVVPDSRASREIDAFGAQLDDYPDGVIVGSFGAGSGARPDMWLCPLQRQASDDPNEVCSTYAYKWATGTIKGSIGGLREGDKATVTLTPVNSNDAYADDLADDMEVTAKAGGAASYTFSGVADGRYMVTLEANAGSWGEDETGVISVMHDESNDDDDYTGDVADGSSTALSATDLRGVIRGRIANDSNGRSGLTSDESRAGVMVNLHAASAPIKSGANKGRRTAGADVVATAETDGDGVFMFEGLTVGKHYFVKPQGTDLYTAVRSGDTDIKDEKATDVVTHALTTAGLPPAPGSEPAIPTWDYHTSTATVGAADFVLLYKDGEVEGKVSDPSVRAAHSRSVVELRQCKMSDYDATVDSDGDGTPDPADQCTEYTGVVVEASVDAKGNWGADDLREGLYEVVVDMPAGYINVSATGTTIETDDGFHSQQFVELMGGRADDDTETFHIKDRNAGDGATLTGGTIEVDGTTCTVASSPTNATPQCGHSEDGSFSVVVAASAGATIRLSASSTDAAPAGTYSQAVNNGRASTVSLSKAGTRTYYVHVAAEDGYAKNNPASAGFSIRRNADVRVGGVTIEWSGDRIELDRDGLDLDPDGETDPVTGTTTKRITVETGDNGADIPAGNLTVTASSMTTGFGVVTWGEYDVTTNEACGFTSISGTSGTLTFVDDDPATEDTDETVNSDGVCFRITDSDGAASDPDQNASNTRDYVLIFTRK